MVALVVSIVLTMVLSYGAMAYIKRRPADQKSTWGEAIAGAAFVSFVAFIAYGIVPHQWLTLAENEWAFRADKILSGKGDIVKPRSLGGWFPVDITYRTISDIMATNFYIVFVALQLRMWKQYQTRGETAEAKAKAALVKTSSFGRPLIKQG